MKNFETVQDVLNDLEELEKLKEIFDLHKNIDNVLKISNKEGYHLPSFEQVVENEVAKGGGRLHVISRKDVETALNPSPKTANDLEKPVEIIDSEVNKGKDEKLAKKDK